MGQYTCQPWWKGCQLYWDGGAFLLKRELLHDYTRITPPKHNPSTVKSSSVTLLQMLRLLRLFGKVSTEKIHQ